MKFVELLQTVGGFAIVWVLLRVLVVRNDTLPQISHFGSDHAAQFWGPQAWNGWPY